MDEIRIKVMLNDRWGQDYIFLGDPPNICDTVLEMIGNLKRFQLEHQVHVYNPCLSPNPKPNLDKCRHEVWGDSFYPSQCSKKGAVEIQGYMFCKQHAKMVMQNLQKGDR